MSLAFPKEPKKIHPYLDEMFIFSENLKNTSFIHYDYLGEISERDCWLVLELFS